MPAKHFCEVLVEGLAPDGGLVVPDEYPQVTLQELTAWRDLSYAELAFEILRRLIDDIPASDLRALTARTYTRAVFGTDAVTPATKIGDDVYLLGLSNGPTFVRGRRRTTLVSRRAGRLA